MAHSNWFKRICQSSLPPSYMDIGHGYHKMEENQNAILWVYANGRIEEQLTPLASSANHPTTFRLGQTLAVGRIDPKNGMGSICFSEFGLDSNDQQKREVINALVEKYTGVRFFVYGHDLGVSAIPLQKYWEMLG